MHAIELIMILLGVAAAMAVVADRLGLPRPVFLIVGGALLAVIPGLPRLQLDPEVLFLLFVPPLLYRGALQTSLRDFTVRLRPIAFLSIVMVLVTTAGVAWVAHAFVPGFGWAQSCALGAIISPTDTVAALAVTRRLRVPQAVITVLQGEGLVNDAAALVAYRAAVAAGLTGVFAPYGLLQSFFVIGVGGASVGLGMGWCIHQLRHRLDDVPVIQNTISLLTPYAAYVPADQLGLSGVLAVVSAGMYLGWQSPRLLSPATRLQADAMWDMIVFILEGLIFILVGLELPYVLQTLRGRSLPALALEAAAVSATVILVRLILIFPGLYLIQLTHPPRSEFETPFSWREVLVVGWAGIRGGESLVIALSLPLATARSPAFAQRDLIIFLTFCVILATLLLQGLTLNRLVHGLGLRQDGRPEREEAVARARMARAALDRLEALEDRSGVSPDLLAHLRQFYEYDAQAVASPGHLRAARKQRTAYIRLRHDLIEAQRRALIQARNAREINEDVMRRLQRELDFQIAQRL